MQPQPPRIRFKPVLVKARHDGWTPARQFRFIAELAAARSVTRAAQAVGMSRESAYTLRDRPEAAHGFALAWRKALEPDFAKERRRSPRAALRLRRLQEQGPVKVDEAQETHDPANSLGTFNQLRRLRELRQLLETGWSEE